MPIQTRKQPEKSRTRRKKQRASSAWLRCWPLILGIAVTPLAVKTAEILPLMGGNGLIKLRLLYPFAMLLREHALGFSEANRESLSQIMLYAQFPLYGLFVMAAMKWKSWGVALAQLAGIHVAAFSLLWLLGQK